MSSLAIRVLPTPLHRKCLIAGCLLWWTLPTVGKAHHETTTTRLGSLYGTMGVPYQNEQPLPRLNLGAQYDMLVFGRTLNDTSQVEGTQTGEVLMHTVTTDLSVELRSRSRFGLRLPVGVVRTRRLHDAVRSTGLGDLQFFLAQRWPLRAAWSAPQANTRPQPQDTEPARWSMGLRTGVVVPTGVYDPRSTVRLTDLQGRSDGSLALSTGNAQASLGAGTYAMQGGLFVSLRARPWLALTLDGGVNQPLRDTEDRIRWGSDVLTTMAVDAIFAKRRLVLRVAADHLFHSRDLVPADNGTTSGDPAERSRVGGRHELGLAAGISACFRAFSLGIQGHIPVWQKARGLQLVETFSLQAICAYSL